MNREVITLSPASAAVPHRRGDEPMGDQHSLSELDRSPQAWG